jgi:hypothetical protein
MVEQLAKVDPGQMTDEQKLAFWINVYNALMMHVINLPLLTCTAGSFMTHLCIFWLENKPQSKTPPPIKSIHFGSHEGSLDFWLIFGEFWDFDLLSNML